MQQHAKDWTGVADGENPFAQQFAVQVAAVLQIAQRHEGVVSGLELQMHEQELGVARTARRQLEFHAPDLIAASQSEVAGDPLRRYPAQRAEVQTRDEAAVEWPGRCREVRAQNVGHGDPVAAQRLVDGVEREPRLRPVRAWYVVFHGATVGPREGGVVGLALGSL